MEAAAAEWRAVVHLEPSRPSRNLPPTDYPDIAERQAVYAAISRAERQRSKG